MDGIPLALELAAARVRTISVDEIAGRLADRLLRRYARAADDFGLYTVIDLFESYRASVRAKVAAIAASDSRIDEMQRRGAAESVRRHLELAEKLATPRNPGAVVIVGPAPAAGGADQWAAVAEVGVREAEDAHPECVARSPTRYCPPVP